MDRDSLLQEFYTFAQKKGAISSEEYTEELDSFFQMLRSKYTPYKFYRQLTMIWIYASKDSWDLGKQAGYVTICAREFGTEEDRKWKITMFCLNDVSNIQGFILH